MLSSLSLPEASAEALEAVRFDEEMLFAVVSKLEKLEKQRGDLRGLEARTKAKMERLSPWRALAIPIERLGDTRETVQMTGCVPDRMMPSLLEETTGLAAAITTVACDKGIAYLWILAHRSDHEALLDRLKRANFSQTTFQDQEGTIAHLLDEAGRQLLALEAEREEIAKQIAGMTEELPRIKLLYELVSARLERETAMARLVITKETFLLTGWVPAFAQERLENEIRAVSKDVAIAYRPANDDESPPVKLQNNRFAEPFESIVESFSWPDPRGFDPTFVMAPFFLCFFGMMLSDAGYGIVMAILMPLAIHFLKPKTGARKMMYILGLGGVATIFWGAMFDTWFGMSVKPMLVNPLEDPLKMMAICLGFGAVHLFSGLFVGAYRNFKDGKPLDALYDQFSWFFFVSGLGLMLLPAVSGVGKVMAIASAVLIALTAARDKKNWLSRIMSGLGALYGATSWLSDLLSYMRLFGMGLATGVIGMVINQLTGLIFGKNILLDLVGVAILIGGHIFNALINTIGAYVHASRLQYIEFFGKFYQDGGRPFAPLSHHPRYVVIRESATDHAQ